MTATKRCVRCGDHTCVEAMWWTQTGAICSPCHEATELEKSPRAVATAEGVTRK